MPRVLLVGWDGAGWDQIHPLLDSGWLPNLSRLIDNGAMGDLAALNPPVPALLWSSIATGRYADRHGVLDAVEPDPVTDGVRAATRASLRVRQIWDLLAREGHPSQVIGWPVTQPSPSAAAGPASCVSDQYPLGTAGSIFPPALEAVLSNLRLHPTELTGDELQLFVPELARVDQDKDRRLALLALMLTDAVSAHSAATTLHESQAWDFTAVYYAVTGRAHSVFPPETDEIYKDAVQGAYRLLDLFLGRLIQLAGPDTTVMLVSDRNASERERKVLDSRTRGGILCAAGPGIEPDELAFGAGILDIVPTILGLFGYAPSEGMPGRPIAEICSVPPVKTLRAEPNAETCDAEEEAVSPEIRELEDLGYTDPIAASWREEGEAARRRREFHLAQVLLSQGRAMEAVPIFEGLVAENPESVEWQLHLGNAYFLAKRIPECSALCESLVARWPDSPYAPAGRAHLAIAEGKLEEALRHLADCRKTLGMIATLDASIGAAYLGLGRNADAAAAYRSAIETDPALPDAHEGLGHALLAMGQSSEAAQAALDAIRLRYARPSTHQLLGHALQALQRPDDAAMAFRVGEALARELPVS